jgi:hypothetical protein
MKIVLTKEDWSKIKNLVIKNYYNNDYDGAVYYSDIEVEIPYEIEEDGYREEDTGGWVQTTLNVEIKEPKLEYSDILVEYDYWELRDTEISIHNELKQR